MAKEKFNFDTLFNVDCWQNDFRKAANKIMAKNTKKTIKQIEKDTGKDYYMSSKEAKEYGIIDDIIKK